MESISNVEALEMLAEVAGFDAIGPNDKFGTLGLDSLMLIEWVSMLEEKLDREFDLRDVDVQTLGDLGVGEVLAELLKCSAKS